MHMNFRDQGIKTQLDIGKWSSMIRMKTSMENDPDRGPRKSTSAFLISCFAQVAEQMARYFFAQRKHFLLD
jgi:hypothetical protein